MRDWDSQVDEIIIKKLVQVEKAHFNQLLYEINKARLPITQRKLSKHLQRLQDENIIVRDEFRPGLQRYSRLTKGAKIQRFLGIYHGIQSKKSKNRKKNGKAEFTYYNQSKNKKLIWLLFGIASEYNRESFQDPDNIDPDDSFLPWGNERRGVSLNDALTGRNSVITKKYFMDNYSRREITNAINKLRALKIFVPAEEIHGETRYDFTESHIRLSEFVLKSLRILDELILRMKRWWIDMKKKATPEQISWFISTIGELKAKEYLLNLQNSRFQSLEVHKEVDKEWLGKSYTTQLAEILMKERKRNYKESMNDQDSWLKEKIQGLEENYKDVKANHRPFYDIAMELINPSFVCDALRI